MANSDKTEQPTAKRKSEARKRGQVAKSADLSGSLVVIAGLVGISAIGPAVVTNAAAAMRDAFARIASPAQVSSASGLASLFHSLLNTMLATAAPIAGICLAVGLLSNIGQVGLKPTLKTITPNFKKLNPAAGAKNLFGTRALFETFKSLLKVGVVGAVAALALIPQITSLGASVGTSPGALGQLMASNALGMAERAAVAYLLIGVIDFVYQRRRNQKSMKMTKQEVKEEYKQYSLPPEVKGAVKRRQMQLARARMMASVPQADVVVTNPTHYAAALSYDGTRPAPVLIAKGMGHVALQIRRIAEESGVPIVPDPPLARALHGTVEIGQMIPEELYAAVAQVLAFVYRMAGRRRRAAA